MFVRGTVRAVIAAAGRVMTADLEGKWICPMHPSVIADEPDGCPICGMDLVPPQTLGYVVAETDDEPPPLVIPVSAALVTGTRAIVYVEVPDAEQPTFVGREIVLGPRVGDHYLVHKGLEEGEMVVSRGNFKLDAELQIRARPAMMSPEGGAMPGHDHGEPAGTDPGNHAQHAAAPAPLEVPHEFHQQLDAMEQAAQAVSRAQRTEDLQQIRQAFAHFEHALYDVDEELLSGHALAMWRELAMLLNNDAFEGRRVQDLREARRVHQSLNEHVQRAQRELGMAEIAPEAAAPDPHQHH
jgi:membrane fusion protein, copper/silver efflux system